MTESDAREIFLIRAIEQADPEGELLGADVQVDAAKAAGGAELVEAGSVDCDDDEPLTEEEGKFLAARAVDLHARLSRKSLIPKSLGAKTIPGWFGPLLVAAVLVIGFLSANLGSQGAELNILALPLLGILAWNIAVYGLAVFGLFTGASRRRSGILIALAKKFGRLSKSFEREDEKGPKFGKSDQVRFAIDWFDESIPIHSSRLGVALHLAAAALAIGGVGGLFYQGWSVQYVAVWESTLFNADSLKSFFSVLFGPASLATGVSIPLDALPEMQRGAGLEHKGGDALPWLQLYAGTMAVFVVVPRAVFAMIYQVHAKKLQADFPLSNSLRPYLTKVLLSLKGESQVAEVIPYAFSPESKVRDSVRGLLHSLWGGGIYPEFRDPVEYGDEDDYLEDPLPDEPKYTVLLMNFSATPEDEAHGYLGKSLRDRVEASESASAGVNNGRSLLVLLDATSFSERFAELPEFSRRVEERRAAWERVMKRSGLEVATVNLHGSNGSVSEVEDKIWMDGVAKTSEGS